MLLKKVRGWESRKICGVRFNIEACRPLSIYAEAVNICKCALHTMHVCRILNHFMFLFVESWFRTNVFFSTIDSIADRHVQSVIQGETDEKILFVENQTLGQEEKKFEKPAVPAGTCKASSTFRSAESDKMLQAKRKWFSWTIIDEFRVKCSLDIDS